MTQPPSKGYDRQWLAAADQRYLWHPFTQMKEWMKEPPLIIAAAEGSYLIDIDGNRYLDGVSSLWVNIHGHRRKEIDEAIKEQIDRVSHTTLLGLSSIPSILLAKELVERAPPGLAKVFFSDNGSTAVEIGLKIAFQYWHNLEAGRSARRRFVAFRNAYHGDTLGAVSVGGIDTFHEIYRPLLIETFKVEYPYCYRCSRGRRYPACSLACTAELEEVLKNHGHEIAAVVVEPLVQCAAGILTAPPGFLEAVATLCKKHDVLLIADEVAVGFGRTGKMFAVEHEGVCPDILALAKGITGGYLPLAATLVTERIFDAFLADYAEMKAFFHGHSYTGNPLACAAGLASLRVFDEDRTLERLGAKIARLGERLEEFRHLGHVGDVRQKGFIAGIELVQDKEHKKPYPTASRIGHRVIMAARRKGLILRPLGDVIVIMPPLSIAGEELDRLLDIVYTSIVEVTESGRGVGS
jgi:adenosylmethionine-8-amino-7-oxononanoate aminotransferase